jgi:Protein of unknown function (DUF1656)
MRRSRAPSNWPGPFFAARSWAGCTTNMFGFDSRQAHHFGLLRHVWHPALFVLSVYMIILSSIVLIVAR